MGALKTNRVMYPCGIKQVLNQFALLLCKHDINVNLVTVNKRNYYVYRMAAPWGCSASRNGNEVWQPNRLSAQRRIVPLAVQPCCHPVMKANWMGLKMQLLYYVIQKMRFFFPKHCEHLLARMLPLPHNKFWIIMWSVGRSNYFSVKARISLH